MTPRRWGAALLLGQAIFLALFCDSLPIALVAATVAIAAFAGFRMKLPSAAMYPLLAVIGVAVTVATYLFHETPVGALGIYPMQFMRPLGQLFLLWQCLLLVRQSESDDELDPTFAALAMASTLCAFDQVTELKWAWYTVFATVLIVLAVFTDQGAALRSKFLSTSGRRRAMLRVFGVAALLAIAGVTSWIRISREIQTQLPSWVLHQNLNRRVSLYVSTGRLGAIGREQLNRPNFPAFRVYANGKPGYLRSRAFDSYSKAQWRNTRSGVDQASSGRMLDFGPMRRFPPRLRGDDQWRRVFAVHPTDERPLRRLEIHNDPRRGVIYFTPLGANYVLGTGDHLMVDLNGIVHAGLDPIDPYVTYDSTNPPQEDLPPIRRQLLTTVPREVDPRVRNIARRLGSPTASPTAKITAVRNYLLDNFQYELSSERKAPRGVDPLSHFLLTRHAAHCEYFASAAVMLLRMQGVPSRYVTGYVVTEMEDEYGEFWVARNRNAHAWAEAYDIRSKQWVVVEATPGMEDVLAEQDAAELENLTAEDGDGRWQNSTRTSWNEFFRTLATQFGTPAITLGIVFGACWLGWKRYGEAAVQQMRAGDKRLRRLRSEVRRMERRLRRQGLIRQSHETWRSFEQRVLASGQDAWLREAAALIADYARYRYRDFRSPERLEIDSRS